MKKKITIVGGGFTGIIISLILSKKYEITLIEQKNNLGGILSDIKYDEKIFYKGCQYLDSKSIWFKEIYKILNNDLKLFAPSYFSYTEFGKKKIFSDKFACPVFEKIKLIKKIKHKKKKSLKDRFNLYEKKISNYLSSYVEKFNIKPEKYVFNSALNLQLDRIASPNQKKHIKHLKKIKLFDDIYALENSEMGIFHKSALPIKGYDNFFLKIQNYLKKKNVKILLGKKIIPSWNNGRLNLIYNNKILNSHYIIWTANPVVLLNKYFNKKLDSKYVKINQFDYNLKVKELNNFYIQVFSSKTPISRIFFYKINNKYKLTVECSELNQKDINNLGLKIIEILNSFKIDLNLKDLYYINSSKYLRFDLCTIHDLNLIKLFRKNLKNSNLITSEWETYGREKKINNLIETLKEKKIL